MNAVRIRVKRFGLMLRVVVGVADVRVARLEQRWLLEVLQHRIHEISLKGVLGVTEGSKFIHLTVHRPMILIPMRSTSGTRSTGRAGSRMNRSNISRCGHRSSTRTDRQISSCIFGLGLELLPRRRVHTSFVVICGSGNHSLTPSIRKFFFLSLLDGRTHSVDVLVSQITKHGDRGLILKLPFSLHDVHHDVRGLVIHFFGDELVAQEHQGSDVTLFRSPRISGKLFVKPQALTTEYPLKLKLLGKPITIALSQAQVHLGGHHEEGKPLSNHTLTSFLIPDHATLLFLCLLVVDFAKYFIMLDII